MARNWVGIDVAKAELVVAVAPHGEVFTVANTADGVTALVERLRFAIFSQVGRVVRHAGERFIRVAQRVLEELVWRWRRRLRRLVWAPL